MPLSSSEPERDPEVLHLGPGDMLAFDHYRGEVRVIPSQDFAVQSALALPHAQQAARDFANEGRTLREALCELHRAVSEHDGSDADDARLSDALRRAQELAPYEPEEADEHGF